MLEPIPCDRCPLRALPLFERITDDELALIQSLKRRQVIRPAGTAVIAEGQPGGPLFTLLRGWAFRFKTLSDGRRQILNFLVAGDFIGVQQKMNAESAHGVQALTEVELCAFDRDALWSIHRQAPGLGFDVTWLAAHEEALVDENLLSVGRRSAKERVATLLVMLYRRAAALSAGPASGPIPFPLTQQHIADALGLSLVHTNRTLRALERLGLHRIAEGRLELRDLTALKRIADLYGDGTPVSRPLI